MMKHLTRLLIATLFCESLVLLASPSSALAGTDDIVWQHDNGQVHYWQMQAGKRVAGIDIEAPVSSDWHLKGVGDVNGDGTDDIVWQQDNGQVHYWQMQAGKRVAGINILASVASDSHLKGVGDVDGIGNGDIIWRRDDGQIYYWFMVSLTSIVNLVEVIPLNGLSLSSDWHLKGVGDVDGDGNDDIVWQHQNGQVHYWQMQAAKRVAGIDIDAPVSSDWHLKGVGDLE